MKVLHLLGAREDSGGILTVLRNLRTASPAQGVEHWVYVHRDYEEVREPSLNLIHGRWILQESPNHFSLFTRSMMEFPIVSRLLRARSFDIVHAHTRGTLFLAASLASAGRVPVLFTNHTYARRRGLYRKLARHPRLHTVVLTPNMAKHYGIDVDNERVSVISACFADGFLESRTVARRPMSGSDEPIRLVGLGNIIRWKNWHVILKALGRLSADERKRFAFHHWGPVPDEPDCVAYHAELRTLNEAASFARVEFHGMSLDVEGPLRQGDWFVLPSTNEPCSVAMMESLALGIPVLVSNSGGNVDIVRDGETGLRFKPDDDHDLALKLRLILQGRVKPASPSEIRESVRERSASAITQAYLTLYDRLLSAPSDAARGPGNLG